VPRSFFWGVVFLKTQETLKCYRLETQEETLKIMRLEERVNGLEEQLKKSENQCEKWERQAERVTMFLTDQRQTRFRWPWERKA